MDGYDVFTSDGARVGTVAGRHGDALVVETGNDPRVPAPAAARVRRGGEDAAVVRSTLAKELVVDSPEDPGWTPGPGGGPIVGRGVNED